MSKVKVQIYNQNQNFLFVFKKSDKLLSNIQPWTEPDSPLCRIKQPLKEQDINIYNTNKVKIHNKVREHCVKL